MLAPNTSFEKQSETEQLLEQLRTTKLLQNFCSVPYQHNFIKKAHLLSKQIFGLYLCRVDPESLPTPAGTISTRHATLYLNGTHGQNKRTVQRLLGPERLNLAALEEATGCTIVIRQRNQHMDQSTNIVIEVRDYPSRAKLRLQAASQNVRLLLNNKDHFDRLQGIVSSILNGKSRSSL